MEKKKIDLEILLPELPNKRDACVNRIIQLLQQKKGIDQVHLISERDHNKAQLCFHYDPSQVTLRKVEQLAKKAGADITAQYGHLLIETTGVRHLRHARIIEAGLEKLPGLLSVAVSGTGYLQIEFQKAIISRDSILEKIEDAGLRIDHIEDPHEYEQQEVKEAAAHEQHTEAQQARHDHKNDHGEGAHEHAHSGFFGEKTELIFALVCGAFLGIGFGMSFIDAWPTWVSISCYIVAYFFGGFYTGKEAVDGIRKKHFEIDFLMLVAAIGAAFIGQWAEGALLLFLFSLGHSLEHYAMGKAKKSIAALAGLAPKTAFLKSGNDLQEVPIEALKPGDVIVVKPNSKISADGIVIQGNSSVNQAPITGESMPADKKPVENPDIAVTEADQLEAAYKVFAGSINGGENLEIKVTKLAADSTLSRLVKMVNEAQTQKSPTQNFTDKLEKYYVPSVLILVLLLLFAFLVIDETFSESFYRAMAVLVAASPCALAISTPSAVLSGVARAARGGVLIKGGRPLEELGSLTAIAFDKTGTLTEGKPALTTVHPLNGTTEEQLLETVIAVEKLSDHPLAVAIVKDGTAHLQRQVQAASNLTAIQGRGIRANYKDTTIHIGNKELFIEKDDRLPEEIKAKAIELEQQGQTTMIVQQNEKYIGLIALMDVARKEAKETLAQLRKTGIQKMVMLTGDNQQVAEAIANEIGITEAWGNLLPGQKVAAIEKLSNTEKKIAMVGDGVNDAPAMAKSTVGIAMGAAGSDVALETADVALMADRLSNLHFAIGLSRKARKIVRQNLVMSLGMVVILIPLTILGIAHIGPAVMAHEGSTLVVVFNALRLLAYKK